MKPILNYHLHTTGSDGKLSPEEVVKKSIEVGLKFICITDHYILPIREWGLDRHSEEYYKELERLQKKYGNKIDISIGAEFDWLEGYEEWFKEEISKRKRDFVLGSIHFLKRKNGKYDWIDRSPELSVKMAEEFGGIKQLIGEYYKQIKNMIRTGLIDCVGHLDIIKKCLDQSIKDEKWYKEEVLEVLKEVKKAGICIEINSSGWRYLAKEQYPSRFILDKAFSLGIPITIGSDGHKDVNKDLEKAYALAKEVGYKSIFRFKNRKRIEVAI